MGRTVDDLILNLGCGPVSMPDAMNIDINPEYSDALWDLETGTLPDTIKGESVGAIYASHILEHFWFDRTLDLLRSCWRSLKPGGMIRITCPDMLRYWKAKKAGASIGLGKETVEADFAWKELGTSGPYGHKMFYDAVIMRYLLSLAGFRKSVECRRGESAYRSDIEWPDDRESNWDGRQEDSFFVEGLK
jgi:SAM-dependent methyltransferase